MSAKVSQSSEALVKKTRLLLFLWDMGGVEKQIKKGELNERLKRKKETAKHYQDTYEELEKAGAIALSKNTVSLSTPEGLQMLNEGLKSDEFQFDSAIGAKAANALLKWFREQGTSGKGVVSNGASAPADTAKSAEGAIASYEHFKSQVLPLFDKLDKTHNYSGLVPIWHLRHELGKRVSREEFNDWMMEMQADQLFYLQSGEARGATDDQKRDSITDDVRGLLFFASQPS
jgi:hypothetical protein